MEKNHSENDEIDLYQYVTDNIIAAIEMNPGCYHTPWHRPRGSNVRPVNVLSRQPYHGVNALMLWATADERGYTSGLWGTDLQWSKVGAQVRADEREVYIVRYWKKKAVLHDDTDEAKNRPRFSRAKVFAAEQVDGCNISLFRPCLSA